MNIKTNAAAANIYIYYPFIMFNGNTLLIRKYFCMKFSQNKRKRNEKKKRRKSGYKQHKKRKIVSHFVGNLADNLMPDDCQFFMMFSSVASTGGKQFFLIVFFIIK